MCLIIVGKSNQIRSVLLGTLGLISDIYMQNSDGVGAMYHDGTNAVSVKALPKSSASAREFIEALPDDDRELALHWRMRTHGDVNTDNCHPYAVAPSGQMMHNGVLAFGNEADPKFSDTWHFCRKYLDNQFGSYVHQSTYNEMVGKFIGDSNRLVFLTSDGRMSVVNRSTGYEAEELWFSNLYAWDSSLLGFKTRKYRYSGNYDYYYYSTWNSKNSLRAEDFADYDVVATPKKDAPPMKLVGSRPSQVTSSWDENGVEREPEIPGFQNLYLTEDDWYDILMSNDHGWALEALDTNPDNLFMLFAAFDPEGDPDTAEDEVHRDILKGDCRALVRACEKGKADMVAYHLIFTVPAWSDAETGEPLWSSVADEGNNPDNAIGEDGGVVAEDEHVIDYGSPGLNVGDLRSDSYDDYDQAIYSQLTDQGIR